MKLIEVDGIGGLNAALIGVKSESFDLQVIMDLGLLEGGQDTDSKFGPLVLVLQKSNLLLLEYFTKSNSPADKIFILDELDKIVAGIRRLVDKLKSIDGINPSSYRALVDELNVLIENKDDISTQINPDQDIESLFYEIG